MYVRSTAGEELLMPRHLAARRISRINKPHLKNKSKKDASDREDCGSSRLRIEGNFEISYVESEKTITPRQWQCGNRKKELRGIMISIFKYKISQPKKNPKVMLSDIGVFPLFFNAHLNALMSALE